MSRCRVQVWGFQGQNLPDKRVDIRDLGDSSHLLVARLELAVPEIRRSGLGFSVKGILRNTVLVGRRGLSPADSSSTLLFSGSIHDACFSVVPLLVFQWFYSRLLVPRAEVDELSTQKDEIRGVWLGRIT